MNQNLRRVLIKGGVDYALTKNQLLDMLSTMKENEFVEIAKTNEGSYRLLMPTIEKQTQALRTWSHLKDLDHKKGSTLAAFVNEVAAFDLSVPTFVTRKEVVEHSLPSRDN